MDIQRTPTATQVLVDEGVHHHKRADEADSYTQYALNEPLIAFGSAVDNGNHSRWVTFMVLAAMCRILKVFSIWILTPESLTWTCSITRELVLTHNAC